ncbi:hypothetical protein [Saccharopolyspora mangrovi]|uniref:WXG100 family type VII secretion target n=1 Tax=Saccharopolyspora mangrovi TaxID=3082379 RepID=A0ABU6AH67_9PSEU|nr:hypothetical protein [Saccharopolyspora sp. S2-29]MEB3370897.1 hypothetical protein [Saccharopolyspora sp. S2-29]
MTAAGHSDHSSSQAGKHGPPARRSGRRGEDGGGESGYSSEVARQVGEATVALGERLRDPGVAHSVEEIEKVMRGFSLTVEGMSGGLSGVTEWLRAAGHVGPLSGHASVMAERLSHIGKELSRLADAIEQAQQRAS